MYLSLVSETRISFSNYAYLLTVLSSLKLPLLVSETRVFFFKPTSVQSHQGTIIC